MLIIFQGEFLDNVPNKGLTRYPVFRTRLNKELNKEKDESVQFLTRIILVKIYRGAQFGQ